MNRYSAHTALSPDPLCWHRDELEDKRLDAACCFESEPLHVKPLHDEFIEVAYECRKQKKHRVLSHEGFWKPVPAERFFKRAQRTNLFGLCRALETKVALPIRYSCHRRYAPSLHEGCRIRQSLSRKPCSHLLGCSGRCIRLPTGQTYRQFASAFGSQEGMPSLSISQQEWSSVVIGKDKYSEIGKKGYIKNGNNDAVKTATSVQ